MRKKKILLLSGGVGGAKLADGFAQILPATDLIIAVNTGDDFQHLGLSISPDLDSVTYMLAGLASAERGWGRSDETWSCIETLRRIDSETWFQLGDRDLALHLHRSMKLARGTSLEVVTAEIASKLGVRHKIVPMTEAPVRTIIESYAERYSFQEYFVRLQCRPQMTGYRYEGARWATPSHGLLEALHDPELAGIMIAPSNPILSIGPILAIPTVRDAIEKTTVPVVGVSPIIKGAAIKGPAAKILQELNIGASAGAVAQFYGDLLDHFIVHPDDAGAPWSSNAKRHVADILMQSEEDRRRVAHSCLALLDIT